MLNTLLTKQVVEVVDEQECQHATIRETTYKGRKEITDAQFRRMRVCFYDNKSEIKQLHYSMFYKLCEGKLRRRESRRGQQGECG